jgi:hypothetical protein
MDRELAGARPSWHGALALCTLVGLAAGSIHVAWGGVRSPPPVARTAPIGAHEVSSILQALHAKGGAAFTPEALIARPLFAPNRKPYEEIEPTPEPELAEQPAPPPPPAPPSYLVDGVMVFAQTRKILLRHQPREPGQWLSQGDTTGEGWTIVSIEPNEVVLKQDGRSVTLSPRTRRSIQ